MSRPMSPSSAAASTGLSAAYHLAKDHGVKAVVLERAYPGWGASGRNGGFCCMGGSKLSWKKVITTYGLDQARAFHQAQSDATHLVGDLLAEERIDADRTGTGDIALAHRPSMLAEMATDAEVHGQRLRRAAHLARPRGAGGPGFRRAAFPWWPRRPGRLWPQPVQIRDRPRRRGRGTGRPHRGAIAGHRLDPRDLWPSPDHAARERARRQGADRHQRLHAGGSARRFRRPSAAGSVIDRGDASADARRSSTPRAGAPPRRRSIS